MAQEQPTKARLAAVLKAEGLSEMAIQAAGGYYDDYDSPLTGPLIQLYSDLVAVDRQDLADRVKDGEWDGTREESEAWWQRTGRHCFPSIDKAEKKKRRKRW